MLMITSALDKSVLLSPYPVKDYSIGLVENLGSVLYREYLLPMELSAVLFFIAMAGVMLLSRKEKVD